MGIQNQWQGRCEIWKWKYKMANQGLKKKKKGYQTSSLHLNVEKWHINRIKDKWKRRTSWEIWTWKCEIWTQKCENWAWRWEIPQLRSTKYDKIQTNVHSYIQTIKQKQPNEMIGKWSYKLRIPHDERNAKETSNKICTAIIIVERKTKFIFTNKQTIKHSWWLAKASYKIN